MGGAGLEEETGVEYVVEMPNTLPGPQIEARCARQLYYQTDLCTANLLAAHESLLHP